VDKLTSVIISLKKIMLELAGYFDNARFMLTATAGVALMTLVAFLIFRKLRFVKYLPGLIVLFMGVHNFYSVMHVLTAESSLEVLLMAIIGVVAGLVGLLFALILGIIAKPVKRRKRRLLKSPDSASASSQSESENKK
jgi:hypothetical protein